MGNFSNNDQNNQLYGELISRLQSEISRRRGYGTLEQFANLDWINFLRLNENDPITSEMIKNLVNAVLYIMDLPDPFLKSGDSIGFPNLGDIDDVISTIEREPMVSNASSCRSACTGTCASNCITGCSSCKNDCTGGCYTTCSSACGKGCTNGCGVNCQSNCSLACGGSCSNTCNVSCANNCNNTCVGQCNGCYGSCNNTCAATCKAVCIQHCGSLANG